MAVGILTGLERRDRDAIADGANGMASSLAADEISRRAVMPARCSSTIRQRGRAGWRFIKGWPLASENIDQHRCLMIYL
jgi:hypothetical protein